MISMTSQLDRRYREVRFLLSASSGGTVWTQHASEEKSSYVTGKETLVE